MNRTTMSGVEIPRNFILLDELEKGEKSQFCDPSLSWGLTDSEDVNLSDWNASILGPSGVCFFPLSIMTLLLSCSHTQMRTHCHKHTQQTRHEGRLYFLTIHCGPAYPKVPPEIRFVTRINMGCVDKTNGRVEPSFPGIANWASSPKTFDYILMALKREMGSPANARLPQPPEGAEF